MPWFVFPTSSVFSEFKSTKTLRLILDKEDPSNMSNIKTFIDETINARETNAMSSLRSADSWSAILSEGGFAALIALSSRDN
ncbi:uncharacterized protein OCT59_002487 [Rhizophagus irregularis]|uniref:uncharacterized protein n=1 Tax=Rhizophagus irregularis TaxID=588596 RepID=UPI001C16F038|nr:hypothetical protein OCT59_002487 [Rhizophagus irregularis]CAB4395391.1 unnamed protein product [Rhizophagus irregularis]CAB5372107.1 unnamed protein product [Rhizophagus irregularis]